MKRLFPFFAMLLLPAAAHAVKLDIVSDIRIKASSYEDLVYIHGRNSETIYTENVSLGFVVKDIALPRRPLSTMDIGVILQSMGTGGTSSTVDSPQFQGGVGKYESVNGSPFVRNAYVRIYNFGRRGLTATLGRQDYRLGQGITLSSSDQGFPGVLLEADSFFGFKTDIFAFRPYRSTAAYTVFGASVYRPSKEGVWQFYHFRENSPSNAEALDYTASSRNRSYTGARYFLSRSQLEFDGEFAMQGGSGKKTDGTKVDYEGMAFMMKGAWNQPLGFFGTSKFRLAYGRSSGNPGAAGGTDKAFFPAFGSRNDGLERGGYGAIMGASLYDTIKTSGTVNGMPEGVSGLNVINIGADMPYKRLILSVDYFKYRASKNVNSSNRQLGTELDLGVAWPIDKDLVLKGVYAIFTPGGLYPTDDKAKLVSAYVQARF
ncbi:MAG: alginate export family protein [Elusimicrobiales bacterium]|nr:alginate export family protein [Elusimicrobiales bacterium]